MEPMAIGVFSNSLHPKTPDELFDRLAQLDLHVIQLGFIDPDWRDPAVVDRIEERLQSSGVEVQATFFGFPGEDYSSIPRIRETGGFVTEFDERLAIVRQVIDYTVRLGIRAVGAHAGFIPEDRNDPLYATMIGRVGQVADEMAAAGLTMLLETGQETAEGLLQVLGDLGRDNVRINFDPANILLYGVGEPVEAVKKLGSHVASVHAKDATPSGERDVWGREVLLGEGAVDYPCFLRALKDTGFAGPLIIECEMGGDPMHDVGHARDHLREWVPKILQGG